MLYALKQNGDFNIILLFKRGMINKKVNCFTLIEIIIVAAILGIIAGITMPKWMGYKNLAEERIC